MAATSLGAVATLRVDILGEHGEIDNLGEAKLTEEGLILEGYLAATSGITWADLARLLEHPFVQEKLEQAEFEALMG